MLETHVVLSVELVYTYSAFRIKERSLDSVYLDIVLTHSGSLPF